MANITLKTSCNGGTIRFGEQSNGSDVNLNNSSMPKYVGARATVTRTEEGVRIWLKDYQGETTEIVAEAIQDIVTNDDGTLTFILPDGREITTDSLEGPQGAQGPQGIQGTAGPQGEDGVGIASITKTGTSGLVDTYTITYTDGTTSTYTVTNGQDGTGAVTDVEVDGVSVVTDGVAGIDLSGKADVADIPSKVSDLTNDSGFSSVSVIARGAVGANIADITIDGVTKKIYSPEEVFFATYGTTTYSELRTAYMGNKSLLLVPNRVWLTSYDGSTFSFIGFDTVSRFVVATLDSEDTWTISYKAVPSKTSDLTNDSGFITLASVPTKTSDLTNDSGFITSADVPQEIFWATYGTTTSAQIEAAYQAGKVVCVKYNSSIYTLNYRASAVMHIFGSDIAETHHSLSCDNNVWSASTTYYPPLDANDKIIDFYLPDYHDIFWATYGTTTNAEIDTAINAGKIPMVAVGGRALPLRYAATLFHRFVCVDNGTEYTVTCASDTWGTSTQSFVPVGSNGKIDASYLPTYNGGVS